jgi:hypothetical protein
MVTLHDPSKRCKKVYFENFLNREWILQPYIKNTIGCMTTAKKAIPMLLSPRGIKGFR